MGILKGLNRLTKYKGKAGNAIGVWIFYTGIYNWQINKAMATR